MTCLGDRNNGRLSLLLMARKRDYRNEGERSNVNNVNYRKGSARVVQGWYKKTTNYRKEEYNVNTFNYYAHMKRFMVGLKDTDEVTIDISPRCEALKHCEITNFPETDLCKTFTNIYGLKKELERALLLLKQTGSPCSAMIHQGIMHYFIPSGIYQVRSLLKLSYNLRDMEYGMYERLLHDSINFDFVKKLPCVKEFIRFDVTMSTPDRHFRVWYKLFVGPDGSFITNIEDIDVNMSRFVIPVSATPGFLFRKDRDACKIDVINPLNNFTTRIKLSYMEDEERVQSLMEYHAGILKEVFFDKIKIVRKKDGLGLNALDLMLPDGYKITYYRKCLRNVYNFNGNLLRTSEERHANGKGKVEKSATDIFIDNTKLNEVFRTDWNVDTALEALETGLKFQDDMMDLLN